VKQFMKKPFPSTRPHQPATKDQQGPARPLATDEMPTVEQPALSDQRTHKTHSFPPSYIQSPDQPTPATIANQAFTHTVSSANVVNKHTRRSTRRIPRWARGLLIVLTVLVVLSGGAFAYYEFTYASSINDITGQTAIRKNTVAQTDPLTGRTNILLLGSDTDGKGNDPTLGQPLAQTIIILTIDPKTNYVGMLSIPRDMQVTDNAYSYLYPGGKIDEVFQAAWQGQTTALKARAAAGHIMDVIQSNYGISIDHYAWVGLQGFVKVIDELGGVNIDVTHPITDDDYPDDTGTASSNAYGYRRLYLPPGPQHLDGQTALEYVRTRHADLGGDFGRTERQQQVLSQIKEEATQSNAIAKAPQILKDLDGYLMTDLTLNQLASLAQIAQNVDINKIDRLSLTPPTYAQQIANGRGNYAPLCPAIEAKVQQMFATQPNCIPQQQIGAISPSPSPSSATLAQAGTVNGAQASAGDRPIAAGDIQNILKLLLLTTSGSFSAM
jgi:cell envelope-related function transcriptional attenuator common domain